MKQKKEEYNADLTHLSSSSKSIFLLGGISSMILIVYSLATILIMVFIGPPPETITECFTMLNLNRFFGLLRLDILTVFAMPLYYLLFYSIYKALKKPNTGEIVTIITIFIFVGLTLFLATPSVFSYLDLSDKYAIAASEIQRNQLLSAGEAILSSDMWHGTGAKIGGMLLQTGALLISVVMLKQKVFNKLTAYTGIFTHGLDLAHILIGFFLPAVGNIIMAIAGPLYLLWFPLVGARLFKLSRYCQRIEVK
ncbi:MAG: hypothetical protein ACYCXK_01975 [Candidatus Humimicrobiaceae bacterium]